MLRSYSSSKSVIAFLFLALLTNCGSKKMEIETPEATENAIAYETVEDKSELAALYQLEHMKDWYPERILPPAFDFKVDITNKTITELWLLRNEIFARNNLPRDAIYKCMLCHYPQ